MAIAIASIELRKLQPREASWVSVYQASLKRTTFETIQNQSVLFLHHGMWNPKVIFFRHYKTFFGKEKTKITMYYNASMDHEDTRTFDGTIHEISFTNLYPEKDILQWSIWEPRDIKSWIIETYSHLRELPDLL